MIDASVSASFWASSIPQVERITSMAESRDAPALRTARLSSCWITSKEARTPCQALKAPLGVAVVRSHAAQAGVGVPVVRGDDHQRIRVPGHKLANDADRVVERQLLPEQGGGIVGVGGVIDASAFDLEKKAVGRTGQTIQRGPSHFRQCRKLVRQFGLVLPINGVGQMAVVEQAQNPLRTRAGRHLLAMFPVNVALVLVSVDEVLLVLAAVRLEELEPSTHEHVDHIQVLLGDLVLTAAFLLHGGEPGRRRVCDRRGGHQSDAATGILDQLGDRRQAGAVRQLVQRSVEDPRAASPRA